MIDAAILKAITSYAAFLSAGSVAVIVLWVMAFRTGSASLAIAGLVIIGSTAVTTYYVHKEQEACEARFMAAEQNFEDMQNEVGQLVGQIAARAKVVLTERERLNAEELRSIRVRLADTPVRACIATGTDAADDRRLRHDGTGKATPQG